MRCSPPVWYNGTDPTFCPYGRRLLGDVTLPNHLGFFEAVAVAYSLVPVLVVALSAAEFALRRGTRQLVYLGLVASIVCVNEVAVKPRVRQPRPGAARAEVDYWGGEVGSCCLTCGMPSTHSAFALGSLTLLALDGVFRAVPSRSDLERAGFGARAWQTDISRAWFSFTPLAPVACMLQADFAIYIFVWLCLLLPVPMMRVRLYDHSLDQAFVGSAQGVLCGCAYYFAIDFCSKRCRMPAFLLGMLKHDYRAPVFRVKVHGKTLHDGAEIIPFDCEAREEEAAIQLRVRNATA